MRQDRARRHQPGGAAWVQDQQIYQSIRRRNNVIHNLRYVVEHFPMIRQALLDANARDHERLRGLDQSVEKIV
jgi:hypothetical protein